MKHFFYFALLSFFIFPRTAVAEAETDVLKFNAIVEFAEKYCEDLEQRGWEIKGSVSGGAKLALEKILKRIGGLGIEGAADVEFSDFEGFEREDLLEATKSVLDCRVKLLPYIQEFMFPEKTSQQYNCQIPGDPSGSAIDRAKIFNDRGVGYSRNGQTERAIDCYKQALLHNPDHVQTLVNLFINHSSEDKALNHERAFYYIDRAIASMKNAFGRVSASVRRAMDLQEEQRKRMCRSFSSFCENLTPKEACLERSEFTGEFWRIDVWTMRAGLNAKLGKYDDAIDDIEDLVDHYPKWSCARDYQIARALNSRIDLHCKIGAFEEAARDARSAISLGAAFGFFGTKIQTQLKDAGYYNGNIDGIAGSETATAYESWALDGCPPI